MFNRIAKLLSPEDLAKIAAPSPHYAGIPEVLDMGRRLGLKMPGEIRILALEVERPDVGVINIILANP